MNARTLERRWASEGIRFGGALVYLDGDLPSGWSASKWRRTIDGCWFREFRTYERGLRVAIALANLRRTGEIRHRVMTSSFDLRRRQAGIRTFGWRIRRLYTGQQ